MRKSRLLAAALFALVVAACSSSSSSNPPPYQGFVQPANTVAVNFRVDDSTNRVYAAGELLWKGSMTYDPATRKITYDANWTGGTTGHDWAPLYDDGPWDVLNATTGQPGHEPKGSVAGDHKWGVTVFASTVSSDPQYASGLPQTFEYGLVDANPNYNYGWIWQGGNGTFTVTTATTPEITAQGMTFSPFGTTNMKLVIDTNALLAKTPPWDTSTITVKGGPWAWVEVPVYDDGTHGDDLAGDGKYTFVLSNFVGAGTNLTHTGLLKAGDTPEFVFVFGGVEYKDANSAASPDGVTAFVKFAGAADWTSVPVEVQTTGYQNTFITTPAAP